MNGLHIGTDLRRFAHGKLPPLAITAIILLPLLFGGLFPWAYWDPIGNIDKMPVALVNSDEGDAGQEVVDNLLEVQPLNFQLVSAEEAREGIEDGRFYLGMEIPTDFSDAVTSVNSDNPHQAKINIALNETNGFIPTMLGNQATTLVTSAVSDTVGSKVVDQLFVGINTLGDGLDQAAEGAGKLDEGAGKAKEGSDKLDEGGTKLNDGVQTLNEKVQQLPEAVTKLDDGAGKLQEGAKALNAGLDEAVAGVSGLSKGLDVLEAGTLKLGAGATAVSGGVDKIAGVAGQLQAAQVALNDINANLNNVIRDLDRSPIPGSNELATQARAAQAQLNSGVLGDALGNDLAGQLALLQKGAAEVSRQLSDPQADYLGGVNKAVAGARKLVDGLQRLDEGSSALLAGLTTLKDGTSKLVVAANTATDATSKLAAGSNQLVVGLGDLNDGLVQLSDGTGELSMKLSDGSEKAPRWEGTRLDRAIEAASNPVVANSVGDGLTYFGKGLSPFFLSLSLWFGALITFMMVPQFNRRAIDSGMGPSRALLNTLLPAWLIGAAQCVVLWAIQMFLLNVEPEHPWALLGVLVFVDWVFVNCVTTLNCVLGPAPGRLVTMALMSLQLVASNGIYPPEVQPGFIQWVHSWDPMRFSVDLVRYALFSTSDYDPRMWTAFEILLFVGLAAIAVSAFALLLRRQMLKSHLHPEISV